MKPLLWTGIALGAAAVLAVPLWLAVDDGGPRRAAALAPTFTEGQLRPTDVARLTIEKINGGAPIPVAEISFTVRRPVGSAQPEVDTLDGMRRLDLVSPALLSMEMRGVKAPSAKLELLGGPDTGTAEIGDRLVLMIYDLSGVTIHALADVGVHASNDTAENISLDYDSLKMSCPACTPWAGQPGSEDQLAIPGVGVQPIQSTTLGSGKGIGGAKVGFKPLSVALPHLSNLVPELLASARSGSALSRVTIDLVREHDDPVTYASFDLSQVVVTSFELTHHKSDRSPVAELELAFRKATVTTHEILQSGQQGKHASFCWNLDTNAAC